MRVEVDDSTKRMNAKIRDAQVQKVPYMLVIGQREMAHEQVAVRLRTEEDLGAMTIAAFIALAQQAVAEKRPI